MSALTLIRRARPLSWTFAALGVVAIVSWQAATWAPPSTGAADDDADRGVAPRAGLTLYSPGNRVLAPPLRGATLDGDRFTLADLIGKVVVINVWGSWCGPCRAETPELVRLAREEAGRGVRFVGINTRDNASAARSFTERFDVPYPSVKDGNGRLLLAFRHVIPTAVVPSSIVIDRDGKVAARIIGRVTYTTLKGLLDVMSRDVVS